MKHPRGFCPSWFWPFVGTLLGAAVLAGQLVALRARAGGAL